MNKIKEVLLKYWGYNKFKPQQEIVIKSIISGKNALVVLPTGGGKSLCYQLPSLIIRGTTLVVSPLIALMEDQIRSLNKLGISSFYFKSDTKNLTIDQQLDNCIHGNYNLVYCSPERFKKSNFLNKISQANITHIAIDEAHCISEWGHEFRPSYRKIKELINFFPRSSITAYTGSANLNVKNDIIENLGLANCVKIESSYERKNISYNMYYIDDKIKGLLNTIGNESSIIYCSTRKSTEIISKRLSNKGFSTDYFHGGMSREEKKEKLLKWHSEKIKTIVATTAFGMGIDKSNVRKVIHYNIPESIENYYQETGRAGRDGKDSNAILLINSKDISSFLNINLNSLPTKTDLFKTYKNLCNHLQIFIGEGEGDYFDFNLTFFCKKYNLNKRTTLIILYFLENNDLIILNYFEKNKINVIINSNIDNIKESIKLSTPQSKILESLLRCYPSIMDKKTEISIEKLTQLTKLDFKEVNKYLEFYDKMNLLDLNKTSSDIQLRWMKPREDNYIINPLIQKLEKVNNIKENKFKKIIDFINDNKNCKTKQLLNYFGEEKNINCMNCSSSSCN